MSAAMATDRGDFMRRSAVGLAFMAAGPVTRGVAVILVAGVTVE